MQVCGHVCPLLADAKRGELKPVYRPELPNLAGRPFARRDLFRSKKYVPFQVVQTMRGCPYPCEFCSVSTANGTSMRFRPADEVLAELRTLGKLILFADDNVMIHRAYSRDLFTRMVPLQKKWVGQCSLAAVGRLENIHTTGRQGNFRYNNMDQSVEMGRKMGIELATGIETGHEAVATGKEYFG